MSIALRTRMLKRSTRVRGLLAMVAVVACASRSLDDTRPEGVDSNEAGAAGDATPDGTGGTPPGAAGGSGTTGQGGTASGGRGGASAGNAGTAPSDAGSGGNDATGAGGLDGGTSGISGGDPCSDGGAGGACSVERDPTCVTDCWSAERTPAILDADGSWCCPDSAPRRAEECHIDCTALYDGWEENDYVCGAGAFCAPRGLAPYHEPDDSCTGPLGTDCRCTLIPSECPETVDLTRPTCGADGKSYANACEMWQSRMSYPGESEFCRDDRPDHYLCQSVYCREGVELCEGPNVVDDNSVTWGRCTESACVANGGCACLVEELGPALSPDEESPGPVPYGYDWCSDEVEGRIVLR